MRDMEKTCIFEGGNYKVMYKCIDDPKRMQISHFTQVSHMSKPEWHVDFHNLIVESWEDADDLVHQLSCLVRDVREGESNGTL